VIHFFTEGIDFEIQKEDSVRNWILLFLSGEGGQAGEINYIFCSDEYLLGLNRSYLNHDYYTDILTFPSDGPLGQISADIYISVERVADNADDFGAAFWDELHRVMIHGILHLLGHDDHDGNKLLMRQKEERALAERPSDLFHVEH
jgi:rRNA maturation RNase YbeY